MKRYTIELSSMEWGLIAIDLAPNMNSLSSRKLVSSIRDILDHCDGRLVIPPDWVKDATDGTL
jgi:hypothetical protein